MATTRILVVDDEEDLCEILKFNLEIEGYEVDTAYSAEEALKKDLTVYNLLLLDVMMGEISGFKMARILRQDEKTANTPFSIRQVIARVKAVLRRTSEKSKEKEIEKLEYETLALDTKRIKATVDGVEVPLTKKEFEILKLLLENKGNVFSREEILSRIWKDEVYVLDRTIDVNITRLRKKIGPYGKNIVTRLGFGYCFEC